METFWRRFPLNGNAKWAALCLLGGVLAFEAALRWIPFPHHVLDHTSASMIVTDREGNPLRIWLGTDDLDSRPLYVPDPSDWIVQAMVAAEDQRFWTHRGVDVRAIMRAVRQNIVRRRIVSGASTLSTQVIRLVEPRPRTWRTKVIEGFRALQMERHYDKEFIVGQYLNRAPFGGNIVGIEAAARRYFDKRPKDLSLAEAALLAGVPQSPSRGRPDRFPGRAQRRQQYVLGRMHADGWITAEQLDVAAAQLWDVQDAGYPFAAPHFTSWVGAGAGWDGVTPVRTTLDPKLQQLAESTVRRGVAAAGVQGGAMVILCVESGAVRAMVGSPAFDGLPAGQVNAAVARRAAGSTLKPFAYALGIDAGWLTPRTVLTDVPTRFRDYEPRNFDPTFRGRVTVQDALVLSLNLPAIEVVRRVGQDRFHKLLQDIGLSTVDQSSAHYGIGLVLGNAEVRLLELSNAYAALARGGEWRPVRTLEAQPVERGQTIFSEAASWMIAMMLSGDERAMDATGHAADTPLPRVAWKTGTSAGLRDAWTIAYNPEYVAGVWVGNPDGSAADSLIGRLAATPLAWAVFRELAPGGQAPWYSRPADIVSRRVCAETGRPVPGQRGTDNVWGQAGTDNSGVGTGIVEDWAIAQVTRHSPLPARRQRVGTDNGNPRRAGTDNARAEARVRITGPAGDSAFRLLDGAGTDNQRIALTATADDPAKQLHWFVNDQPVGQSRVGEPLFWPLERGEHIIVCASAQGASDRIRVTVD